MSFDGPLEDRVALQELNASYSDAVTRLDPQDFTALWAADAVWIHPEVGEARGQAAIAEMIRGAFAAFPMVLLRSTVGQLAVAGEGASAIVYVDEVVTNAAGVTYRAHGRYDDAYVKKSGRWLFRSRAYRLLHRD